MRTSIASPLPLALALLAGACDASAPARSAHPIIEGDPVSGDAFPTVVGLTTNAGTICTGTLIAPDAVLTAAHCVEPDLLRASLGEQAPDELIYYATFERDILAASEDQLLAVDSVEWHAEFLMDIEAVLQPGVTQWNDIALVHLAEPIDDREPQRLAPTDVTEALAPDDQLAVAGYGMTDDSNPASAGTLTAGVSGLGEIGTYEILAGEGDPQQACRGDSGGPVFADDGDTYQIGVASRINANLFPPPQEPPPCETGLLYTRVDAYRDWIAERVAGIDPDDDGDDEEDPEDEDDEDSDGGGCNSAGGPGGSWWLLGLLMLAITFTRGGPRFLCWKGRVRFR